ncbi:MAG TPA: AmpG family muropeptide MFS transporter [Gammaproteobacteria bacterium]|nr:AmpG family muropeptide MFS transporter [Gammaproteobacteria bacterium]
MNRALSEYSEKGLGIYTSSESIRMVFLGFSAGLPHPLLFATLTLWLASAEVSISEITMFGWVGIIYAIKFLWAPMLDRLRLPGLTSLIGQRRSWMLLTQAIILVGLIYMSFLQPESDLIFLAYMSIIVAFASASQDVAIDAYRIEIAESKFQAVLGASYQLGYRISALTSGAGALYLASFYDWKLTYQIMSMFMLVGIMTVIMIPESTKPFEKNNNSGWLKKTLIEPFAEFFKRNGYWSLFLLMFIAIYRVSDLIIGIAANPFYADLGFNLSEIATVTKVFGFTITIIGAFIGGLTVARFGISKLLIVSSILLTVTNLFFLFLNNAGPSLPALVLTISADNFALGFSGTVFIAFLSSLTSRYFTASQYALFTSVMFLPGITLSGFSGQIIESSGWSTLFIYSALLGIPSIACSLLIVKKGWKEQ